MDDQFDLEALATLEQTFYDEGYKDGFDHGRIHGLIEGRALGREKGFEMWEELSFYEGFAIMWKAICTSQHKEDGRAMHHIRHILELISRFPRVNPGTANTPDDVDIPQLFRQIRSRYKALCSILGVKPSLRAADGTPSQDLDEPTPNDAITSPETPSKARPIWKIEDRRVDRSAQGLDF